MNRSVFFCSFLTIVTFASHTVLAENDSGGGGASAQQKCMDNCSEIHGDCIAEMPEDAAASIGWFAACELTFKNCKSTCTQHSYLPPQTLFLLAQNKRVDIMTFLSTSTGKASACQASISVAKSLCGVASLPSSFSFPVQ